MRKTIKVSLDMARENFILAKCVQYDDLMLEAKIFENGVKKTLTDELISLRCIKPDGSFVIQNTEISKNDNIITILLDKRITIAPGMAKIEIRVTENGNRSTTFSFKLFIKSSVIDSSVRCENAVPIVEELQEEVEEAGLIRDEIKYLIEGGNAVTKNELQVIEATVTTHDTEIKDRYTKLETDNFLNLKADKTTMEEMKTQIENLKNGSPRGVFATLQNLKDDTNANTVDGKKNIYVVSEDGGWYYWNNTDWIKGGTYQGTQIADNSITSLKRTVLGEWGGYMNHIKDSIPTLNLTTQQLIFPANSVIAYRDKNYELGTSEVIVDFNNVQSAYVRIYFNIKTNTFNAYVLTEEIQDKENSIIIAFGTKANPYWSCTFDYNIIGKSKVYLETVQDSKYAKDVNNNNQILIMPHFQTDKWYVEETYDDNGSVYLYVQYLAVRNAGSNNDSTWNWSDPKHIKAMINNNSKFVTSPSGQANYLKINSGEGLVYDIPSKTLKLIETYNYKHPEHILLAFVWHGVIVDGIILNDLVAQNRKSVLKLEADVENILEGNTAIPDYVQTDLKAINKRLCYEFGKDFKFGFITDIHGKNNHYRYLNSLSKYNQLKSVIVNGDINSLDGELSLDGTQDSLMEISKVLGEFTIPVLATRGNHDGVTGGATFTTEMFTNALIRPFNENTTDKGYYFKDFTKEKIRVIMLNSSEEEGNRAGFSQEQVNWLSQTLNATQDGWSVITCTHHNLETKHSSTGYNPPQRANEVIAAIKNFKATKTQCKHIGHWFGHEHYDLIEVVDGITYIATLNSLDDKYASPTVQGAKTYDRVTGTDTEYAMDIVCINQTTSTVNLLRFGAGENRQFTY